MAGSTPQSAVEKPQYSSTVFPAARTKIIHMRGIGHEPQFLRFAGGRVEALRVRHGGVLIEGSPDDEDRASQERYPIDGPQVRRRHPESRTHLGHQKRSQCCS